MFNFLFQQYENELKLSVTYMYISVKGIALFSSVLDFMRLKASILLLM